MRPFRTCRDPFDTKKFSNLSPEILVEWIAPVHNPFYVVLRHQYLPHPTPLLQAYN